LILSDRPLHPGYGANFAAGVRDCLRDAAALAAIA
jgi:hypothetical protein